MKTLYININNECIQSNDELEVLKYDLDNDFFFFLGERIAKGCKVQNENALITDFNTPDNKQDYDAILSQWNDIKKILFGENVERDFDFVLPFGYIHWLRYHEDYNHVYEANFSNDSAKTIAIDLTELYEDTIDDMQRYIMRKLQRDDLYLDVDEIVFNDENVIRKSLVVRALKEKYEGIGFKPYKKWLQEHECDLEHDESIKTKTCNISQNSKSSYDFFPYKGISLGKTPMDSFKSTDSFEEDNQRICYSSDVNVYFLGIKGQKSFVATCVDTYSARETLPKEWSDVLGCTFDDFYEKCYKSLVENGFLVTHKEKEVIVAITPNQEYRVFLKFQERRSYKILGNLTGVNMAMRFDEFMVTLNKCPYCNSTKYELKNLGDKGFVPFCTDCNKPYLPLDYEENLDTEEESDDAETPSCPSCYSDNVSDDGSGYLQYTCQDCGHNWGHCDTVECPECGSDDVEYDGTDCYPYECNACGHMWEKDNESDDDDDDDDDDNDIDYDGDTDNDGNPMSEYYESFGIIIEKSTRLDVQRMGGVLVDSEDNQYEMPNGIKVFFYNSHTVSDIWVEKEAKNSLPNFYKNLGIYWAENKHEFRSIRSIFENLGFIFGECENDDYHDEISAFKYCAKFNKCVTIQISYSAFLGGMYRFKVS